MSDWLFISYRHDHWLDGWTYGDWRQYIAKRPDGSLQCCRVSGIPLFAFLVSSLGWSLPLFAGFFVLNGADPSVFARPEIIAGGLIGLAVAIGAGVLCFGPWSLMTAVGPRQYEGKRVFSHEVERQSMGRVGL